MQHAKATDIARSMVKEFGMSEKIGHITFEKERRPMFLEVGPDFSSKDYSEETAREIDNEIRNIVETAYGRVRAMLSDRRQLLEDVAQTLLQKEVVEGEELRRLMDKEHSKQNEEKTAREEENRQPWSA